MSDDKVIPIKEKKSKKREETPSKNGMLIELSRVLHPEQIQQFLPPLRKQPRGKDFRVVIYDDGRRSFAQHLGNQELQDVSDDFVVNVVCDIILQQFQDFSTKDICEVVRMAKSSAYALHDRKPIGISSFEPFVIEAKDVALVRYKSQPGWCWKRLSFDCDASCPPGLWGDFLARLSNADAFLAWVGSLFDLKSNREQYVWLVGEGQTGKSSVIDVLLRCFGKASHNTKCPDNDDRFFTSELEYKRVVHIGEAKSGFVASNLFKSLTGDSVHRIERKYELARNAEINAKFILTSNDYPEIPARREHFRRIILCELADFEGETLSRDDAEAQLAAGLPYLFARAEFEYSLVRGKAAIPCDMSVVEEYAGSSDVEAAVLFARYFEQEPGSWVSATEVYNKLEANALKRFEIRKILKIWQQKKIITPKRQAGTGTRGYLGLKISL